MQKKDISNMLPRPSLLCPDSSGLRSLAKQKWPWYGFPISRCIGIGMVLMAGVLAFGADSKSAFAGQDLHLTGDEVITYQLSSGEHVLVFERGLSMRIGANQFSSAQAVVWLNSTRIEAGGVVRTDYKAIVYLQGNVSLGKTPVSKTLSMEQKLLEGGESLIVHFDVTGEVYITADKRRVEDPHKTELYRTAENYARSIETGPKFVVQEEALVPELPEEASPQQEIVTETGKPVPEIKEKERGIIEKILVPAKPEIKPEPKQPKFSYPIVFAPAGAEPLKIDSAPSPEGENVATIRQRFYVSQRQDEQGRLLELQADNAVVFYSGHKADEDEGSSIEDVLARANVSAIYMTGDVVMTEGQRTIRADEVFYDFQNKKAIAVNAVMRNYDPDRGIPIYVRAARLRQLSETKFSADNVTLTTSEFYVPQISVTASSVIITDTTAVDEQLDKLSDASYEAELRDVDFKYGKTTLLHLSHMRSNMQQPDTPLHSVRAGYGKTFGASVETRWFLARMLGMEESPGTKSEFMLDYYGKKGIGTGIEIEYTREDHFGSMMGYIIDDHGEDRLGRNRTRKDLAPPRDFRGRFRWQHRQFLDDGWQLSMGVDYSSDEHFIEQYFRDEFSLSRRETYAHLKKSQDNWAVSILAKGRINDFYEELEELPSAEFHWTGQSLFDDMFTLYSDTQASHLRQRIGNEHMISITEKPFTFISHRTELDMPIWAKPFKIVPFVAGSIGYDDRSGFQRTLVDGTGMGSVGANCNWIAEAGMRINTQLWKVYPNVKSRLWDLDQLRHIIEPHVTVVTFAESNVEVRQRDAFNIGVAQRWQTKRGPAEEKRTVDWMRLDMEATFVKDNAGASDAGPGPDRFIWNKPIVPLRVLSAPEIFNGDLQAGLPTYEFYGPRRDYFATDYIWRVSDTTAVLSDFHYDIRSGVVDQLNAGFSRLVWPNLSYYVGSRYLRRTSILGEKGSQAFTFAATYQMDPRYTLIVAQQMDLDYGANVRSDITIVRKYHRVCWGITYSADQSLDTQAIMISVWPQGVPELAVGHKSLSKMSTTPSY
ncbi:MAG: hypothetical protein JW804_08395 [Sedimentisphaerales bacterium]|nr:hypothetical protein [Sedimentisphaerales bacterium]